MDTIGLDKISGRKITLVIIDDPIMDTLPNHPIHLGFEKWKRKQDESIITWPVFPESSEVLKELREYQKETLDDFRKLYMCDFAHSDLNQKKED